MGRPMNGIEITTKGTLRHGTNFRGSYSSSIGQMGGGMLKVSVGQMVRTMVVIIAEVITLRMSVGNQIRSLIYQSQ